MMTEQEIKFVIKGLKEASDKLNDVKNSLDGLGYYITDEQPSETDDSISRKAAIDELLAMLNSDYLDGYKYLEKLKQLPPVQPETCAYWDRESNICALHRPSAQPERKNGKWIILDECSNEGIYCSECHKKVFKIDFSNTMKWKNFRYCPNCGADMRGEEDEID